ncbi:MAG TPA: N-acetylmuramoyl-L-alanine amidase [Candidatus Limnocylindria bacterium]|nr:N-acetylmuramoyl-L-alanine amidase [Candidatus Limnocylindria bacterium]
MRERKQAVRVRRGVHPLHVLLITGVLVVSGIAVSGLWAGLAIPAPSALGPSMEASRPQAEPTSGPDPEDADATATPIPPPINPLLPGAPTGWIRVPRPELPQGPRRVGIQAGHWETELAPPELGRILTQTGAAWRGINERELNWEIANKVADLLRAKGIVVDVLPTTVPPGYLADAFVALHGDSDGEGVKSGFKLAHSSRRTPFEDSLQRLLTEEYGSATGLEYDQAGVSSNMRGYYAHSWTRIRYSTSPFTPSVILEMGFVSNDHDRNLMIYEQDLIANAIATGILKFLEATPREDLFGKDLLVPPGRSFPSPSPRP